jgi:hypothetical protein
MSELYNKKAPYSANFTPYGAYNKKQKLLTVAAVRSQERINTGTTLCKIKEHNNSRNSAACRLRGRAVRGKIHIVCG